MNLKALQIFSDIMDRGTLSKAAEIHCLSESAASRQLSVLEASLGFALFSRKKRALEPTPQGKAFYLEAQRILYGLNELPDIARAIRQEQRSSFRLITVPRLAGQIVAPAISRMSMAEPDIKVNVDVQPMRYIQRWIASYQFHLGLGRVPAEHPDITTQTFCSLPVMAVLPRGHRFAHRSELSLEDLEGEPLVATYLKQTTLGKNITNFYHAAGIIPRPAIEVATSFLACSIVASGYGFTITDPLTADDLGTDAVVQVPLKTDFRIEFAFFEPKHTGLSETARLFISHAKAVTSEYIQRHNL